MILPATARGRRRAAQAGDERGVGVGGEGGDGLLVSQLLQCLWYEIDAGARRDHGDVAFGPAGAPGVAAKHGRVGGRDGDGDGPAGDLGLEVIDVEDLTADVQASGRQAPAEELQRLRFTGRIADGVEGEGGLEQRQRRQLGGVGPFEKPTEAVGRFLRVAVVEFGQAEADERLGAGVGEVVAAGDLVQEGGVDMRLRQEDLRGGVVLGAVGGQPLLGERGEQPFGLGPAAGVMDSDLAVRPLDLLLEEEIRLDVQDGLEDFGDRDPVAVVALGRLDVFRRGLLDLPGHLGILRKDLGLGRSAEWRRRHGRDGLLHEVAAAQLNADAELHLAESGCRQQQRRQHGEHKTGDARSRQTCHRGASSERVDPCL